MVGSDVARLLALGALCGTLGYSAGKDSIEGVPSRYRPTEVPTGDKYNSYDRESAAATDRMNQYAHECTFSDGGVTPGGIPIEDHGRVICFEPSSVKSIKEIKWPKIP